MTSHKYWTDFQRNPFMWIIGEPMIGEHAWIGPFTVLDASGGLKIGANCSISAGVHIYTHEMSRPGRGSDKDIVRKPVSIGNHVYLGANAVVMMGCTISDNATVGAGSVVLKDTTIGPGEVWAGVPAKKIR